ncbi:hypothetical protein SFRURICE_014890 [Spodoptera frugiperda]|nr:hypothetical protein SFRURICE_014890 [Spodoptera frugiperda]
MIFHRAVDRLRAVARHTRTARAVDCSRAVDSSPTSLPPPFAASRRLLKKTKEHQLLEQLSTRYPTARAVNNRRLEQSTPTARAVRSISGSSIGRWYHLVANYNDDVKEKEKMLIA